MIKLIRKELSVLLLFTLIVSCGGGGDDDNSEIESDDAVTTWQFESFEYNGGASSGNIRTDSEGNASGVLVITTEEDNSNGDFSGSGLTFTFNAVGSGIYDVVSSSELAEARNEDDTAMVMTMSCTVGAARPDASRYDALSGGSASVSIDNEGRYHIDVASISLERTVDVGDGVPDAPANATLRVNNAFDFSN